MSSFIFACGLFFLGLLLSDASRRVCDYFKHTKCFPTFLVVWMFLILLGLALLLEYSK
jgi:hypothetical protein